MKRFIVLALLVMVMTMMFALPASADQRPPCGDTSHGTGQEYGKHHISPLAKDGLLGNGGHKPGSHHGFSVCDPSG